MGRVLPIAALGLMLCTPAFAIGNEDGGDTNVHLGTGVICDTQQQMERLIAVLETEDTQSAIKTVNTEQHDPTACIVASVAYMRGDELGTIRNKEGAYRMVKIMVVGVRTPDGLQPVIPGAYISVFKVEEIEV